MRVFRWIRPLLAIAAVVTLGGGVWAGVNWFRQAQAATELPVAQARAGEFLVIVRCRGEVRASRSIPIYAPVVPNLTIAWMASAGGPVEERNPNNRFYSRKGPQQLIQKQTALKQAQATPHPAPG